MRPLSNFREILNLIIPPRCTMYIIEMDYANVGVSNVFFQTLSKKNLWGGGGWLDLLCKGMINTPLLCLKTIYSNERTLLRREGVLIERGRSLKKFSPKLGALSRGVTHSSAPFYGEKGRSFERGRSLKKFSPKGGALSRGVTHSSKYGGLFCRVSISNYSNLHMPHGTFLLGHPVYQLRPS